MLAIVVPKGFFPQQDTGAHHRRHRGGARRLVPAHDGAASSALADVVRAGSRRRERRVVHRRRRHQPDDQQRPPLDHAQAARRARTPSADEIIARLAAEARRGRRASRSTCSRCRTCRSTAASAARSTSTRSRTPTPTSSREWAPQHARASCATLPELARRRERSADRRARSCRSTIDRDTASRLGISPQAIDDTLYDAFGQRQVSTIFTQLNLYRVILEVKPRVPAETRTRSTRSTCARRRATRCRSSRVRALRADARRRSSINHQGQFPAVTLSFNLAPGVVARRRGRRRSTRRERELELPPGVHARLPGHGAGVPRLARAASRMLHPGRAHHRLHRARRPLRELHPPDHDPVDAAVGRRRRAPRAASSAGTEFSVIALIGIILLIGIVKKNAIMMIDFALEAERDAGHVAARGDLPGVPAALPPDHDDDDGGAARRPAARARHRHRLRAAPAARHHHRRRPLISQVLTLYTTPVIYLYMERLGALAHARQAGAAPERRAPRRRRADEHLRRRSSGGRSRRRCSRRRSCSPASAAYTQLPVAPLPRVDFPTIQVSAALPGREPGDDGLVGGDAARAALRPHRRRHRDHLDEHARARRRITLQFDLDRDVDAAARDVQAAINAAGGELPAEPADAPDLPQGQPGRLADPDPLADARTRCRSRRSSTPPTRILAQKISQVAGVGQVIVGGGQQPAVRVQVDPAALAGVGPRASRTCAPRSRRRPSNQPKGALGGARRRRTPSPPTTSSSTPTPIASSSSSLPATAPPVRLGDVASVFDDVENNRVAGLDRRQARGARRSSAASRAPTSSRRIERVKALLPQLARRRSRRRSDVEVALDRTQTIRASVHDVELTLVLSVAAGRRWSSSCSCAALRATAIPSVAVPLSLVGTFGVMYLLGYSLDNLSLMALTISTGFVVDDAIVVTENIARYIEAGRAAARGRARGRQADRLHHRLDHRLAARGVHPDPAHGRHRRAALPRVRRHAEHRHRRLGARLADADADDVRAPAASTTASEARPRSTALSERVFDGHARAPTSAASRWVLRHQRLMLRRHARARIGAHRRTSSSSSRRGSSRSRTPACSSGFSEAPQDISFPAMKERQEALNAIVQRRSRRRTRRVVHRRRRRLDAATPARCSSSSSRSRSARRRADEIIARLRPKLAQGRRASTLFLQAVQDVRVGGAARAHAVPVHAPGRRPRRAATRGRRRCSSALQQAARAARTSPPISRPPGSQLDVDDRSRHRVAPRHHAAGHRRHALRRLRPAPGRDDVHAAQPVPRRARGEARARRRTRTRSSSIYVRSATGGAGAAVARSRSSSRRRRRCRSTTRASSRR